MNLDFVKTSAVAEKLSLTPRYIKMIFNGERSGAPVLGRIAGVLGVSVETLKHHLPSAKGGQKKKNNGQHRRSKRRPTQASPPVAAYNVTKGNAAIKAK